jgi:gliding motility-associated-like protein
VPLDSNVPLENNKQYWASQNSFPCESTERVSTTVLIDTAPNAGTSNNYTVCEKDLITINLFDLLEGNPDTTGYWSGPSNLSGEYLGTFEPGINNEGVYTYTVSSTLNICSDATANINVIIQKTLPPTINQTTQTFCEIDNSTVSDLTATGNEIQWYASETDATPLNPDDLLIDGANYWASNKNTQNGCESISRVVVNVIITTVPPPTISESTQTFCEIDKPTIQNLSANGTIIEWYASETDATPLNPDDLLIDGANYWASNKNTQNGCESISRVVVNVIITKVPPPTISESTQTFCEIDNPTVSDLTATGNEIQWYASETSTTQLNENDLLIDGANYWASNKNTQNGCESISRVVVNVIITKVPPPTISESTQTFCEIDKPTIQNLSANGTIIKWYASETDATPLNPDDLLIDGANYWASNKNTQNGCESISRVVVNVIITKVPPPTISESTQTFCKLDNPTVLNLFTNDSNIIWYESENSTSPLNSSDLLIDGEDYWAAQLNSLNTCESLLRTKVNVMLAETLPINTLTSNLTFCINENATVNNLNTIENNVQWYTDNTFDTPINNNEPLINEQTYWAKITNSTSNCEGVTIYQVNVSIINLPAPTTDNNIQYFCADENATIFNLQVEGENIKWYSSENSTVPLNNSNVLENGKIYWATQSDSIIGCESITRLPVSVFINSKIPPTKQVINKVYCEIDKPTIASLSSDNVVWYASENSTVALNANELLVNGEDYWTTNIDTSTGCENIITTVVNVTINVVNPPSTSSFNQSFCEIDNPTISNLSIAGSNINWYSSESTTIALNTNEILINGEDYWATQTNATGCESAKRVKITVLINSIQPPTTNEENQYFCISESPTVANLTAIGNNIQWFDSETDTTPLNSAILLINGKNYWATQTNATTGCMSKSRLVVKAHILNLQKPTTTQINQVFCKSDNPTIANLQINETAAWFDSETSITPLNLTDLLINNKEYWAAQTSTLVNCESIERTKVYVTLTDVAEAVIANTNQYFCASDSPTIANLEASGNQIKWYATETSTSPLVNSELLVDGSTYWAVQSAINNGCESSKRTKVLVTITSNNPPDIIEKGEEFCKISNPTLSNLNSKIISQNGGTITWYDSYPNGSPLNMTDVLIDGKTYFAIETANGCSSINPLAVTVDLNKCEMYDIEVFDGFSPNGNGINDTFTIKNLRTLYPNFKVEFYNRWGALIYTATSSNGDWNGRKNGNGELVPAGIYYFIIHFNKDNKKPIQKRLYLSR